MRKVGTWLLLGLLRLLGMLPLRVHYALGRFASWLAENVIHYRVDVVDGNLALCFPEKSDAERLAIRKEFYRHFGEILAEAVWFGACRTPKRLRRQRLVEIDNPEEATRLFELAPSMVVMYSHCGNWELFGGLESYNYTDTPFPIGWPNVVVAYRELSSKTWDDIMRDNRFAPLRDRKHFPGYVETKDIIRYAYAHRDEKKVYNLNTDQRPYFASPANLDIEFLGQHVKTMTGGAALARKFGMAVAYLSMRRDRRGHYTLHYTTLCEDASQVPVEDIMKQYYALLESEIRELPANYLWTHRRFA